MYAPRRPNTAPHQRKLLQGVRNFFKVSFAVLVSPQFRSEGRRFYYYILRSICYHFLLRSGAQKVVQSMTRRVRTRADSAVHNIKIFFNAQTKENVPSRAWVRRLLKFNAWVTRTCSFRRCCTSGSSGAVPRKRTPFIEEGRCPAVQVLSIRHGDVTTAAERRNTLRSHFTPSYRRATVCSSSSRELCCCELALL